MASACSIDFWISIDFPLIFYVPRIGDCLTICGMQSPLIRRFGCWPPSV
ncbi:hypothetical protein BIFCAT_01975 [Bifidobacterium catenulatum DSM 16992 = JCM 1194 = LMG 11043]|uniref:Uncharacterized protein n=1 Tax=Bifidobacterium catenulatum DSM 16992 = JCM 1194 = LMG 11043 TaxID=566552 RepID=B6XXL5_9BIFI|nr:hypothetical protein BIFCAT_01975 [Bifidobacterium catenulatum DSM 16992 = JCM 1194 = LMG 11043]